MAVPEDDVMPEPVRTNTSSGALSAAGRVLLLSVLLFLGALGTHEVMHLIVLYAVGGHGSLVVRPWQLGLADVTIYALHVQPDQPIGLFRQALVNFLGPALAAVPLAVLVAWVREPVARAALTANLVILAFFALIETGDLLLEAVSKVDVPILTTPEFNYGVPALIILVAVFTAASKSRGSVRRRSSTVSRKPGASAATGPNT